MLDLNIFKCIDAILLFKTLLSNKPMQMK